MQFLVNAKFDFLGKRKIALVVSAVIIVIGIGSLVVHRGPNYGIDFLGGTSIALKFEQNLSIAEIRKAVSEIGFDNAEIKGFGAENEILIRVQQQEAGTEITDAIKTKISEAFPNNPYIVEMVEKVGPKIGAELRTAAVWAILIALFFILLYISWRFEFIFAVGAIAALFHDVLITLGVFSVLQLEISLAIIAAFLTIVGYSLNDTIVVFDRIRENLKVLRREAYEKIINTSINQSLSRTVVTSLTTLIVVLILYVFGGEVIHNFAFALIVGVLVGTYSSVFIASPILVEWQKRNETKKGRPLAKRA
ncbi:protein translocase subunit SecF [candidate division KSB1 bacterium]|nr:protein translocase subunit SecF [candidate division KSB1 bacterium]